MRDKHPFCLLFERYTKHTSRSLSYVSLQASKSGATYSRLKAGGDCTTRRATSILQWFADHWPADLEWPPGVDRPAPSPDSPAARGPDDPLAAVEAALDRADAATLAEDWAAAARWEAAADRAAGTLGADGRIASVAAVCRQLRVTEDVFDNALEHAAAGTVPRKGSQAREVHDFLLACGDARLASRRSALALLGAAS